MEPRKKCISVLNLLLILDAFVLGGFVTLLIVNRLLDQQLSVYITHDRTANDTILNLMDGLLPYYVTLAGALAILLLITVSVWLWRTAGDRPTARDQAPITGTSDADEGAWPRIITHVDHLL
jgi:hypothetical protein